MAVSYGARATNHSIWTILSISTPPQRCTPVLLPN